MLCCLSLAKGTGECGVGKAGIHGSQRLLCSVYKKLWSALEAPSFHPWVSREPPPPHSSLSNTLLSPNGLGPVMHRMKAGLDICVAQWLRRP